MMQYGFGASQMALELLPRLWTKMAASRGRLPAALACNLQGLSLVFWLVLLASRHRIME